jgi:hypothetical protein
MTADDNEATGAPASPEQVADTYFSAEATERAIDDLVERIRVDWRSPRPGAVRRACHDVELGADLLKRMKGETNADPNAAVVPTLFRPALEADPANRDAYRTVRAAVRSISGWLLAFDQYEGRTRERATSALIEHAKELRSGLFDVLAALREVVDRATDVDAELRDEALQVAEEFEDALAARGLVGPDASDYELKRTMAWLRDRTAKRAAGTLGNKYDEHAGREASTANLLRWCVAGLALVTAGAAVWFNYAVTEATLLLELARLSVTVPLGLLALYLARESARHRTTATCLRELAIALHSVDRYIATSPEPDGHALRQALGMRAFGAAPASAAEVRESDLLHTVVTKLTETVSTEVLGRLGLGGNGQKSSGSGESKPGDTKI